MKFGNFSRTFKGDIPPRSTTATYCGASIFRDACYQLVSAFLIVYITYAGVLDMKSLDVYLAQMAVINIFIILCRVWDGVNDPIMGWLIEKFHFKWGKYKPWILIGAIINSVVVLVLFLARPSGWGFVVLFCIFYFLWDIAWTINDIAYWSMLPSLTSDEKRRNKITSVMQICISIGVFGVYAAGNLLQGKIPALVLYTVMPIIIVTLFFLSQLAIVFVCKEKDRSELAKDEEPVKFRDMLRLFKRNDQFRVNIIAILLNYLAAGVLVGFAVYWFNLVYGYGAEKGAAIAFMFTIMYAVGTLVAQLLYPLLSKYFTRKKLFIISAIIITIGYFLLFFLGVPLFGNHPLAYGSLVPLIYPAGFLIFAGQGILAIVIIIQMQSVIEYNDYKFGKREEALVSSMRALTAKFGSSIQQGLIYATLAITGLYSYTQYISSQESAFNFKEITEEVMNANISEKLSGIQQGQLVGVSIGMLIVPWILLMVCIYLCAFVFKIDEKKYDEIVKELSLRTEKKV